MGTDRLEKQPDLLSVNGKSCPYVSNDHPPVCQQPPQTSCLKCPEYLDGLTDLLPWDVETMTENQKDLLVLYKKRDAWYDELDPIYAKVHSLDDPIQEALKRVRREQGR